MCPELVAYAAKDRSLNESPLTGLDNVKGRTRPVNRDAVHSSPSTPAANPTPCARKPAMPYDDYHAPVALKNS